MEDDYKVFDFNYCKETIDTYLNSGCGITKDKAKEIVMSWTAYYIGDRRKLVEYINKLKK